MEIALTCVSEDGMMRPAVKKMLPIVNAKDKRSVGWANDLRVVLALARNGNNWAYVGQIVEKQPNVISSNPEDDHLTKPGTSASCSRLASPEVGILEVRFAKTPKKRDETAHYRIRPSLDGLARIFEVLHAGALAVVWETAWAHQLMTGDLPRYLNSRFAFKKTDELKKDSAPLGEIEFLARISTKALQVLLGPYDFDLPDKDDPNYREISIGTLLYAMKLAALLEIMTMPRTTLEERGLGAEITIEGCFRQGNLSLPLDKSKLTRQPKSKDSKGNR